MEDETIVTVRSNVIKTILLQLNKIVIKQLQFSRI